MVGLAVWGDVIPAMMLSGAESGDLQPQKKQGEKHGSGDGQRGQETAVYFRT